MTRTPAIRHCHAGYPLCAGCFQALAQTIALRHEYDESAVSNLSQAYFFAELGSDLLVVTAAALQASARHACISFQAQTTDELERLYGEAEHENRISFDDDEPLLGLDRGGFIARVLRVRDRIMRRAA